jgi:hypothetical protein
MQLAALVRREEINLIKLNWYTSVHRMKKPASPPLAKNLTMTILSLSKTAKIYNCCARNFLEPLESSIHA